MGAKTEDAIANAILHTLVSPNVPDSNLEPANVVDVVNSVANSIRALAKSILPPSAAPNNDASGTGVDSLTEAVMGATAGLMRIAESIGDLADAVRSK